MEQFSENIQYFLHDYSCKKTCEIVFNQYQSPKFSCLIIDIRDCDLKLKRL